MVSGPLVQDMGGDSAAIYCEPVPPQKSCSSYRLYKILSILYACIFLLVGALLLAIGLWVVIAKRDFDSIHDVLTSPAILAIIVGAVMITTALIGFIASITSSLWPLRVFLGIVIVVFIFQVAIGIVAFVYREQTIENVDKHLNFAIERYDINEQIKFAVDKVQNEFKCCGLNNLTDWTRNPRFSCDGNQKYSCHVPDSCCRENSEYCGIHVISTAQKSQLENKNVYVLGCRWQFLDWLENNLDIIGATALGFAILHILGIFVVYMFITKVEDHHRLFKYRNRYYAS